MSKVAPYAPDGRMADDAEAVESETVENGVARLRITSAVAPSVPSPILVSGSGSQSKLKTSQSKLDLGEEIVKALSQKSVAKENHNQLREKISDGLPNIKRDENVSEQRRKMIAGLRSTCLFFILTVLTLLWLSLLLSDLGVGEVATAVQIRPSVDLCVRGANGRPSLTPIPDDMKDKKARQMLFVPKVQETGMEDFAGITSLEYYETEDWKNSVPLHKNLFLSFGLFKVNPIEVPVDIFNVSCVTANESGSALFAQGVATGLAGASRRALKIAPTSGVPFARAHGSVLIQSGTDLMFDAGKGDFTDKFYHSPAWKILSIVSAVLVGMTTVYLIFVGGRIAYVEWLERTEELVLQYDYLWNLDFLRKKVLMDSVKKICNEEKAEGTSISVVKQIFGSDSSDTVEHLERQLDEANHSFFENHGLDKRDGQMFQSALSAATPFFVLDHLVGNVWSNSEQCKRGVNSAVCHGVVMGGIPAVLVTAAIYCGEWFRIPVLIWVCVHWLITMVFGILYYFYVRYEWRWPFLYMLLVDLAGMAICTMVYVISVAVFLASQIVAYPQEILKIVLPIASVLVYVFVVVSRLCSMRDSYKKIIEQSKKEKHETGARGQVSLEWDKMSLSTRWLALVIGFSVFVLLVFAFLLAVATAVYADPAIEGDIMSWVPSLVMPFSALSKGFGDISGKKKAIQKSTFGALDGLMASGGGMMGKITKMI